MKYLTILFVALFISGCAATSDTKCNTVCKEKCEKICKTEKACKPTKNLNCEKSCVSHK